MEEGINSVFDDLIRLGFDLSTETGILNKNENKPKLKLNKKIADIIYNFYADDFNFFNYSSDYHHLS